MKARLSLPLLLLALLGLFLAACGGQALEEAEPAPEEAETVEESVDEADVEGEQVEVTRVVTEEVVEEEGEPVEITRVVEEPAATPAPTLAASPTARPATATPAPIATQSLATTEPVVRAHLAELEWPPRMRLGDSDVVRLALLPVAEGYVVTADFPEHRTVTGTVAVEQLPGYDIVAAARLDGVGFQLSPGGEQRQDWQPDRPLTWRWTVSPRRAGQQRLTANLTIYWRPEPGRSLPSRQISAFSRGLDVQVVSVLGLSVGQALAVGLVGLLLGLVLTVPLLRSRARRPAPHPRPRLQHVRPNGSLVVEAHPAIRLVTQEEDLLRALFRDYARATVEAEFQSGYSGARTFLVLPIRADGRADAYTIAKLGARRSILQEYENYETYVEHTLPPITARIQGQPVTVPGDSRPGGNGRNPGNGGTNGALPAAALRYTFIGAPGQQPVSLGRRLRAGGPEGADGALLEKLFRTFGPNWWMQRRPYTFRLAREYDCKLPAHYILEPGEGQGTVLDGRAAPFTVDLAVGDCVALRHFAVVGHKEGGQVLSLRGEARPGQPPLRLHWHSPASPEGATARVVATRSSLLQEWTAGFDCRHLPDPLAPLPELLAEMVSGSRSTIHGDLNLENALAGPGDFVWLIDFANTREGHTLFDFAHLGAEIVAHVLARDAGSPDDYLALLEAGGGPLLQALEAIARRCLFDPDQPREYDLALYLSCLGALKHRNLDERARYALYLTAAKLAWQLT